MGGGCIKCVFVSAGVQDSRDSMYIGVFRCMV